MNGDSSTHGEPRLSLKAWLRPRRITWVVTLLLCAWSAHISQVSPGTFFDAGAARNALSLWEGFSHPDFSPAFLHRIGELAWESILIGCLGLAIAMIIAIPLAYLGCDIPNLPDPPVQPRWRVWLSRTIRWMARLILIFFRTVPEIVWAFLFVVIIGLGPGPAVLAIGVTFGGIIGKLYAELAESVDPAPVLALRRMGAKRGSVFLYGVLPQVQTQWLRYALFRLECAIRSASILGVVGAGGLGMEIGLSIRYFQYDKLATALLAVLAYIVVLEVISGYLRRLRPRWTLGLLTLGATAGLASLAIPWEMLKSRRVLFEVEVFLQSFSHPNLEGAFVSDAFSRTFETLGMAFCATAIAALVAFVLAPFATRMLSFQGYLKDALPASLGEKAIMGFFFLLSRSLFQWLRAIPDLAWALLFVAWVGPGPFAGMLAICVHTIGVLGRLFCEVYEEVDARPAQALERMGSPRFAQWLYGVLPSASPRLLAYALFRFEVNVRMTAMMGFVGAGGLGDALHTAIELLKYGDLATLIGVLLVTVAIVDTLGNRVRKRLLQL